MMADIYGRKSESGRQLPVRVTISYYNHNRESRETVPMTDSERMVVDCRSGIIEYTCEDSLFGQSFSRIITDAHSAFVLMDQISRCIILFLELENDKLNRNEFSRTYSVEAVMPDGSIVDYSGSYNRDGLPERWGEVMCLAEKLLFAGHERGMLDRRVYGIPAGVCGGLYIYCGVSFENGGRVYHYIADEDVYSAGDAVLVPVGNSGRISEAEIVSVEYVSEDSVPWPIEKTKHILCHAEDYKISEFGCNDDIDEEDL